jgi:hypothetical protein
MQYRDYGFYYLKRLAIEAVDGGMLFEDLRAMFTAPLTSENFVRVHYYAMDFAQKHFPEDCALQGRLIDAVSRHIGGSQQEAVLTKLAPRLRNTLDLSYSA